MGFDRLILRVSARAWKRLLAEVHPIQMVASLVVAGLILYIAFATTYTSQKEPWYTGEAGDTNRSFRLNSIDSIERFTLTQDGKCLNFLCKQNGQWILWVNGHIKDYIKYYYTGSFNYNPEIKLSPDGSHVGIVYNRVCHWRDSGPRTLREDSAGGQWFVDIDHHIFGGFDRDFKPTVHFSADGKKFAFPYKKSGQYFVQVVDTTFGPYDRADVVITKSEKINLWDLKQERTDRTIITGGEIILGYIKQDRAYIERVYSSERH